MQQQPELSIPEKIKSLEAALALPGIDAMERSTYENTLRIFRQKLQASQSAAAPAAPQKRKQAPPPQPRRAPIISIQRTSNEVKVQGAPPSRYTTRITIERVGEEPEILTLGECRSKFWTRLDELLETTAWQNQLLHQLPAYATFQNAVTYYAALTAFWQRSPSLRDLRFNASRFSGIFEIVTDYEIKTD